MRGLILSLLHPFPKFIQINIISEFKLKISQILYVAQAVRVILTVCFRS